MTILLIPGAGGDAWIWHRVESELVAMGHDAISVDLPADIEAAGIEQYAESALSAVSSRRKPLVAGLSLGSFTAALVGLQIPATALVFVNGMIPLPGETPGEWWGATGQTEAKAANDRREGRNPDADFDPMEVFFHDVPADIVRDAGSHNRVQSNGPFASPWALSTWPDVSTHVIVGRDDRFFPADFQIRISKERLGIAPEVLDGGHLLPLSRPVELAALLDSYLSL
ncbi:MAG: alpha/beta fold hydrolase [Acidimicrobiales bacterium]